MSPSATPATQSRAAPRAEARHQSQPSAKSATPATQSALGCHEAPRPPRKANVHVAKCHACHATLSGITALPNMCVCVEHLNRCKTSMLGLFLVTWLSRSLNLSLCRGCQGCTLDWHQRRRQCVICDIDGDAHRRTCLIWLSVV